MLVKKKYIYLNISILKSLRISPFIYSFFLNDNNNSLNYNWISSSSSLKVFDDQSQLLPMQKLRNLQYNSDKHSMQS